MFPLVLPVMVLRRLPMPPCLPSNRIGTESFLLSYVNSIMLDRVDVKSVFVPYDIMDGYTQ